MAIDDAFKTQPFPEAVEFLRSKITLDTDGWRDIAGDENDAFFVVAGAKGSLLAEMRSITEQAITEGWRPEQFRERFDQVAAGWDGANPWRADLIYRTNIRQAYARGREEYQFDPDVLSVFPYLKYQHSDALQPRPLHKALDGKIFPAQEIPYTCPNGYGCGCRYTSATEDEAKAQGISTIRRGQTIPTEAGPLPVEPDEGFDRTPGAAKGEERDRIIQRVIDRSPPTIAAQIAAAIAAYVPPSTPPLEPPTPDQVADYPTQLPVNHVISDDARITKDALDGALDSIAAQSPDAAERVGKFRQFVERQGVQAVFRDQAMTPRRVAATRWKIIDQLDETNSKIVQSANNFRRAAETQAQQGMSSAKKVRRQANDLAARIVDNMNGAGGYTYMGSGRHIVVKVDASRTVNWDYPMGDRAAEWADKLLSRAESATSFDQLMPVTGVNYPTGDPTKVIGVYFHETGHQVHGAAGELQPPDAMMIITQYAEQDDFELVAESFAAYMMDGDRFRQADPIGYDWITNLLDTALENTRP